MAVPIGGSDDFFGKYSQLQHSARLFGFLMFDDRPSHRPVATFAKENFRWFDELATAAEMFFFIFGVEPVSGEDAPLNPSLEVAKLFDLGPDVMPGILIFTRLGKQGANRGAFLPLKAAMFSDASGAERTLSQLFRLLQTVQLDHDKDDQLLDEVEAGLRRLRATNELRSYLSGGIQAVTSFPRIFLDAMAKAFADAAARRIFPSATGPA